ncbi:hypothetical protein ABTX34_16945 [Streptomyces sp. NPDC096538]|uniref:hypothetical protein n=1 Tax=Streptomyces sp. NPDC096538 TaxID=3155427 RepID=UPI00332B9234
MPMTRPEIQAAVLLRHRLVTRHGLTSEEATIAIVQRHRGEEGPHTHLVAAEATAALKEVTAEFRAVMEALRPAAEAAAAAVRAFLQAVRTAPHPVGRRRDRPAWQSPYGPARPRR